jgi:transposase
MEQLDKKQLMRLPAWKLVTMVLGLYLKLAGMRKRLEEKMAKLAKAEEELREKCRAKAPFSKGARKADPKKPGRKTGQGIFKRRPEPVAAVGDDVVLHDAPLDLEGRLCPKCETPLQTKEEVVTKEDAAPEPKRVITRVTVERGWCPACGYQTRGQHPELGPHQSGANAHQIGPRVLALAFCQHYQHGLPLRKVPASIEQMTGIKLTQSTLTQTALKLCDEGGVMAGHYEDLRGEIAKSPVVNTDDTGWRVNAKLSHLMGFFTATTAYYQICDRHRAQEVLTVLTLAFCGLLGTDRFKSYEAELLDFIEMQKCLSHILKNISEVEKTKTGRAKSLCRDLKEHFRKTLALWRDHKEEKITRAEYDQRGKELEDELFYLLRPRSLTDKDNQRLLNGLWYQLERGRLTLFLHRPEIEPTNNSAERGLRPAVIARKVSHCSKNERGARAYATMKSILTTITLRTKDVVGALTALLEGETFEVACDR